MSGASPRMELDRRAASLRVMMQRDLLHAWYDWKSAGPYYFRLSRTVTKESEFRGPQAGHPSNYATALLRAEPADELAFLSEAQRPAHFNAAHCEELERAIGIGIVDGLMSHYVAYRGCKITLVGIPVGMAS